MKKYKSGKLELNKVSEILLSEGKVSFETTVLLISDEHYLCEAVRECLVEIGKENLVTYVQFILRELLTNANKANLKRVYFASHKLDIADKDQYKKGMAEFKRLLHDDRDKLNALLTEGKFFIELHVSLDEEHLYLSIVNNSLIHDKELEVINEKIRNASAFKSVDEAFTTVNENKEGAGLGIIITVLMLKRMGLRPDNISYSKGTETTEVALQLPLSLITLDHQDMINELIMEELSDIPMFPEHVIELQKKINDPDVDIKDISALISKDPGLTSEFLRISNSALYSMPKKIVQIPEAIKLIGLKQLRNVVYAYGSKLILTKRYDVNKIQTIFDHCHQVALVTLFLAKKFVRRKDLEDYYIGGILHDLGKIIIMGIDEELVAKINNLCHTKGIPVRVIEELTNGYNHALVGAALAKKWNFPDSFIEAIEYHHSPLVCDKDIKDLVYCVYCANLLVRKEENLEYIYGEIPDALRDYFKITGFEQFAALSLSATDYLEVQMKETE